MRDVKVSSTEIRIETCTNRLRFVQKDGCSILQQWWAYQSTGPDGNVKGYHEWRDVPMEVE